ncbi:Nitrogenase [Rhodovastum atsumiense]|uniref:Nitrogenase n=1 Tax=Rhodovastum atsumiense TaxID=504468 RepID=A0A5M6IWR0_9PROT|nr:nitrogenase component 1 [Rhodovastum atsumiense]KAA5612760.1 nitrogenase [Rhodovastum atsumiense]CAH2602676.1 Nitrogenase [Rhodovastum atsumiense]
MAINLKPPSVAAREHRLGTIIGWDGRASDLAGQSLAGQSLAGQSQPARADCAAGCTGRRGKEGAGPGQRLCELAGPFTQAAGCGEQVVEYQATHVRDAVLIHHAPIGCSAGHAGSNASYRTCLVRRGHPPTDAISLSTNLVEQDMVYGGVDKLRTAIHMAWERHRPNAIFVATSCATGIIGDDVESVTRECEDALGIPVVGVFCEGFKSKHWSSGFDAIQHAILRQLVRRNPPRRQDDLINVFVLSGADVYTPMLKALDLRVNLVVNVATVEDLARLSEAAASTSFCYSLASYLGAALEQEFGVPEIKAPPPYGFAGTDAWLRAIARVTHREEQAERFIAREHARVRPQVDALRRRLAGLKGYVAMGEGFAHGVIAVLRELGVEVDGSLVYHHDPVYDAPDKQGAAFGHLLDTYGDITHFSVANGQPFQLFNLLRRVSPDFVIIRHGGLAPLAARLGVPTMPLEGDSSLPIGYQGIVNLGEEILSVLAQRRFHEDLAAHTTLPYKSAWLAEPDPFALARPGVAEAALP